MRRIRKSTLAAVVAALLLGSGAAAQSSDPVVWVSATGTKYHKKTCRTLKKAPKALKLSEAKRLGYTACKVC